VKAAKFWEGASLPLPFLLLLTHTPAATEMVVAAPIVAAIPAFYDVAEHRRNAAVRYEAKRWDVPWPVAYAVSHAENYTADSTARNRLTGALGVMQIHPLHFGAFSYECYGPGDMSNLRRNSCYGMLLLRGYFDQTGSWSQALHLFVGYKKNTAALIDYLDDIVDHITGL
jgi:soluble lytic murein transglycosylase-like protein